MRRVAVRSRRRATAPGGGRTAPSQGTTDERLPSPPSARTRTVRATRARNRLLLPAPFARRRGAPAARRRAAVGNAATSPTRSCACSTTRAARSGPWDPHADATLLQTGLRFDAHDARIRRTDADRAAAEEAVVLHAVPGRGGDRRRPGAGARADRHVLPDLPAAGHPDHARLSAGRHDVPAVQQRPRSGARPPDAGHVHVAATRLLHDLRQPRHAVHPGRRLGDGLGDQGRHAHRLGLDRRRLDRRGRLPQRAHVRGRLPRAGHPQRRQQPVGDLVLPGHRRGRGRHVRGPRCGQRHRVAARRRQRLSRRVRGVTLGGRARARGASDPR